MTNPTNPTSPPTVAVRRRWSAIRLTLFALLPACSSMATRSNDSASSPPVEQTSRTPTSGPESSGDPDEAAAPRRIDGHDLTIDSCTWTWFGEYRIDATWAGDEPIPDLIGFDATLELVAQGDVGLLTEAPDVTVDGASQISFEVDIPPMPVGDDPVFVGMGDRPSDGEPCRVTIEDVASDWMPTVIHFEPPTDVRVGSLQAVAATADRIGAPMLALASLLSRIDDPPFDRLYVAADIDLGSIEINRNGTCIVISQRYDVGPEVEDQAPQVVVVQARGCSAEGEVQDDREIEDPNWIIGASGDPIHVERVSNALARYDLDGAQAVTGPPSPGADEFLDAWLSAQTGVVEITRFAHRGGLVSAFRRTSGRDELLTNTIAFGTPPGVGRARSLSSCTGYGSAASEGGDSGYVWFAAADPTTTIDVRLVDGTLFRVPLQPVPDGGMWFAAVDRGSVPVQVEDSGMTLLVRDADGVEVPCTS